MKPTPMMQQYYDIKKQHPDKYIFFRLGDFYELFDQDALEASSILQITLTKRHNTQMCGIPHHQLNNYAYKLLQIGKKVAIAEQIQDIDDATGIVKREVVRVLTPGTVVDSNNLKTVDNNFIISLLWANTPSVEDENFSTSILNKNSTSVFIGALDISTGENEIIVIRDKNNFIEEIKTYLAHYDPKEIIINQNQKEGIENFNIQQELLADYPNIIINFIPDEIYTKKYYVDIILDEIKNCYNLSSLKKLNMNEYCYEGVIFYTLIYYIKENCRDMIRHLKYPKIIDQNQYLILDKITQKNLELVKNNHDGSENYTLFIAINYTQTSMGRRLLKNWLLRPLMNIKVISQRQENIQFFYNNPVALKDLRSVLRSICDIERYCARISMNQISPKEINYLKESLKGILQLISFLKAEGYEQFQFDETPVIVDLISVIEKTILPEPANNLSQGEVIIEDFNEELKKYNLLKKSSKHLISDLEQKERELIENTKIKIKFTNSQGYFIEISRAQKDSFSPPERYIKKQSLVNADRFVTEELLKYQDEINSASEKAIALENDIFNSFKEELITKIDTLQKLSEQISALDLFCSFAHLALTKNYIKPEILDNNVIEIKDGRHPIVENQINENFIVNSIDIGGKDNQLHIITGPNMSGKSTFLRQNALLIILAQMGGWLPCQSAKIGVCDRIFTRIGANDNISKGESTFLVEMSETASILHHCTNKSFIVMDEIGRGTSTYDGMALAWAIIEYLVTTENKKSKTLFATHYHELIHLEDTFSEIKNLNVSVKEENGNIFFLKKIIAGASNRSYGVHVAKLVGLPKEIILKSSELVSQLEKQKINIQDPAIKEKEETPSDTLFPTSEKDSLESKNKELLSLLKEKISSFDINQNRPIEALELIDEIQGIISKNNP